MSPIGRLRRDAFRIATNRKIQQNWNAVESIFQGIRARLDIPINLSTLDPKGTRCAEIILTNRWVTGIAPLMDGEAAR
jgi:hypothetical protein